MEDRRATVANIIWRYVKIILVCAMVAIILTGAFWIFRIKTDSHIALRAAKNARYAIEAVGIQYYADMRSVYSPNTPDGLSNGVLEKVQQLAGDEGEIRLIKYDPVENNVVKMTFREGQYLITFDNGNGEEKWKIEYIVLLDLL